MRFLEALHVHPMGTPHIGGNQKVQGLPEGLGGRVSEDCLRTLVEYFNHARLAGHDDRLRRGFDDRRKPAFRYPQGIFRQMAFGDVLHRPEHANGSSGSVMSDVATLANVTDTAVGQDDAVADVVSSPGLQYLIHGQLNAPQIIGMHTAQERFIGRCEGARVHAEDQIDLVRPPQLVGRDVPVPTP